MIAAAQYTIADLADPVQQGTEPESPVEGMLWLDTSASPNQLKRWNGTSWAIVNDTGAINQNVEAIQQCIGEIGGRNLIRNTLYPNLASTETMIQTPSGMTVAGSTASNSSYIVYTDNVDHGAGMVARTGFRPYVAFGYLSPASSDMLGLTPGETYTWSADVRFKVLSGSGAASLTTTYNMYVALYSNYSTLAATRDVALLAKSYKHFSNVPKAEYGVEKTARMEFTFTVPDNATVLRLEVTCGRTVAASYASGDFIELSNMKLEKGATATAWTPAPEDLYQGIAAARAYAESVETYARGIQEQVDGKIDTWFFSTAPTTNSEPASNWTTDAQKASHTDDLYYDTSTGYCYRYTGSTWTRIKDSDITSAMTAAGTAQDTADHKRRVFTSTPVPPYDIGDLWAGGSAGDLKVCTAAKAEGTAYAASDWVLASKYTDDTLASAAQSAAATAQSTASSAQSAAAAAQSTAETAQSAASAAQADIDALAIGGRNLIWGTKNPSVDIGSRPAINGLHSDGTDHGGEMVTSASTTLDEVEHGLKATISKAVRPYIRFGSNAAASGTMLGLTAGETYTLSCDAEFKLLSGTQNSTTYYVYLYLYHDAENNGTFDNGTVATGTAILLGTYKKDLKGTVMSKRVEWTFTVPENATMIYFFCACNRTTTSSYAVGDYISLSNLKLEKGNRATDWTAAPEDGEEELETRLAAVNARISNEGDSIRQEVQATYALASDMTQVRSQVSTLSEQTENNYTWAVTRVNQLQDDLDTAREATEEELAVMRSYMSFGEDGLSIGKTGNPFTFRVANDRLAFFMNDTEVAYLSNNKLYVTQAEILTRLIIGKLAFEPQTNGNLSLVFRG